MGATLDARTSRTGDLRSSAVKGRLLLHGQGCRLLLEPDSSVTYLESLAESRLLFGRESVYFYKVQAGLRVAAQRPDWRIETAPESVSFSGRIFDLVEVRQTVEFLAGESAGFSRRLHLRNSGRSPFRLRLISLHDPTAANFRADGGLWGSIGMDAFNRSSHVVMDETADPPGSRVIGSFPNPRAIYMTSDKGKAHELVQAGDVPDSTSGASGHIMLMMVHEFDLSPGQEVKLVASSVYDQSKLEDALAAFNASAAAPARSRPSVAAFFPGESVSQAFQWAAASARDGVFLPGALDRAESIAGLKFCDPDAAKKTLEGLRAAQAREGFLPHSVDARRPGVLETSLYLGAASEYALLTGDKKYGRSAYPSLRRAASFLSGVTRGNIVTTDPSVPQGWRRRLGRGYPTGEIPEVSLALAAGLRSFSALARRLGRGSDAAKYLERSELIQASLRKRLIDERGSLVLNLDTRGTMRRDETADQAVSLARLPSFDKNAASSVVHRLLDKDFESGYGPRVVPTSNRSYFSGSYGSGQLGGYWPRAALSHALLAYSSGYAGIGSLGLAKVSRLAAEDAVSFGCSPGQLPHWVDLERRQASDPGTDSVASARLIEAVVKGELGVTIGASGTTISPPDSSSLKWALVVGLWLGGPSRSAVFVGRAHGKVRAWVAGQPPGPRAGASFARYELLRSDDPVLKAALFHDPGQCILIGNSSSAPVRTTLRFEPRDSRLLAHLNAEVEEQDPVTGSWSRRQAIRVMRQMSLDASLGPQEWKALRISTP